MPRSPRRLEKARWRMKPEYAKALLGVYAKKMRNIIHEVQANETDDIVIHKLAEIAADCAWCDREYGEADNARA